MFTAVEVRDNRTFEDPDSSGKVVDSSRSSQSSCDDGWGGNKIVGEAIVEVALWLEEQTLARHVCSKGHEVFADSVPATRRHLARLQTLSRICIAMNIFLVSQLLFCNMTRLCPIACCSPWGQCIESWGLYLSLNSSNVSSPCSPLFLLTLVLNVCPLPYPPRLLAGTSRRAVVGQQWVDRKSVRCG